MSSDRDRPSPAAVVLTALVYALCITALILFTPLGEHVFIYQAF